MEQLWAIVSTVLSAIVLMAVGAVLKSLKKSINRNLLNDYRQQATQYAITETLDNNGEYLECYTRKLNDLIETDKFIKGN